MKCQHTRTDIYDVPMICPNEGTEVVSRPDGSVDGQPATRRDYFCPAHLPAHTVLLTGV